MSSQSALTLNDGQATPVARTFSARGATASLAKWADVSGGIGIGVPVITMGNLTSGKGSDSAFKLDMRITLPVLEVISGSDGGYTPQPKVAFNLFAKLELVAPNRSTAQNRKDILAFAKNLLSHATTTDAFVNWDVPT
jgi:hypothetical protein